MAGNQSGIQGYVQGQQGTHTAGQAGVGSSVNNGNPNTVYNWSSYIPTVTGGNTPSVNFNLLTSQAPASSAGYTPPFTADPYAAMVLSGIPRASSNPNVDRILSNFLGGGGGGGGFTPNPGTGSGNGNGNGATPTNPNVPVTTPPLGPGTSLPRFVGPISGPVSRNPSDFAGNYANAQPNTNLTESGLGRTANMPWLNNENFQNGFTNTSSASANGLGSLVSGLLRTAGTAISNDIRNEWNNLVSDLSGKNGWQGIARQVLNTLGLGALGGLIPDGGDNSTTQLTAEERAAIQNKLNSQLTRLINNIQTSSGADAMNRIAALTQGNSAQSIYSSAPQMSQAEYDRLRESMQWNAFWNNQGNASNYAQSFNIKASAWDKMMRERRGNVYR